MQSNTSKIMNCESEIINYFTSEKFSNSQSVYLSSKNISKALNISIKKVFRVLYTSDKFDKVHPRLIGSNTHNNNLAIYQLV